VILHQNIDKKEAAKSIFFNSGLFVYDMFTDFKYQQNANLDRIPIGSSEWNFYWPLVVSFYLPLAIEFVKTAIKNHKEGTSF
jgi:hypothetical protein